jgi:hypothetical protein
MDEKESRSAAEDSPQSAARFVRRGAQAIRARSAGISQYRAERLALIDWAARRGPLLEFGYIEQYQYVEGAEHRVYRDDSQGNLAFKATIQNRFGYSTQREDLGASPLDYLRRLSAQNWIFGDDIRLVGVFRSDEHIEIVTSQPWISVHPLRPNPSQDEIDVYMGEFGFQSMSFNLDTPLYFNRFLNLVAADAHDRNVLRDSEGNLVAIDLVIGRPSPRMVERFAEFFSDPQNPF